MVADDDVFSIPVYLYLIKILIHVMPLLFKSYFFGLFLPLHHNFSSWILGEQGGGEFRSPPIHEDISNSKGMETAIRLLYSPPTTAQRVVGMDCAWHML